MTSDKPYILFCAGEDSGDNLGESLLRSARKVGGDNLSFIGSGGPKMVGAGLESLVNYEVLPVSGFGDVLPRYFRLRKCFNTLKKALENPLCKGLVAIDYPGFNMKLTARANELHKPVLYVAPPQAWAWKPHRAKRLSHPENRLAFFFDFEELPYKHAGCNVIQMEHPLASVLVQQSKNRDASCNRILLFPGSRKSQTFRNLPIFLNYAQVLSSEGQIVIVVPRRDLLTEVETFLRRDLQNKFPSVVVEMAPLQMDARLRYFSGGALAISSPGTVTLELALAGCQTVVCTKPDFLTYNIGKRVVKTPWFSLPNLILGKELFPEYIVGGNAEYLRAAVQKSLLNGFRKPLDNNDVVRLRKMLQTGKKSDELMSEFLAQFL